MLIKNIIEVVPMGLIDNRWALVQVMARRHYLIRIPFTDAYIRHYGDMG